MTSHYLTMAGARDTLLLNSRGRVDTTLLGLFASPHAHTERPSALAAVPRTGLSLARVADRKKDHLASIGINLLLAPPPSLLQLVFNDCKVCHARRALAP